MTNFSLGEQLRMKGFNTGVGKQNHTKSIILYNRCLDIESIYVENKELIFIKPLGENRMVVALHIRHKKSMSDVGKICRDIYYNSVKDVVHHLHKLGVQCLGCTELNHKTWEENKRLNKGNGMYE